MSTWWMFSQWHGDRLDEPGGPDGGPDTTGL